MRLLLDSHVIVGLVDETRQGFGGRIEELVASAESTLFCSVASLWEIAIKVRLGKLPLYGSLDSLPAVLDELNIAILAITEHHVLANLYPMPHTRDPFDRLLLAQCQVEGMRLVTIDRELAAHPLAVC
jgi:PIN domain nuclease of toxin-antitoxin system